MSYTFLLEQGEESSVECYLDIPAFVLSRSSHSAEKSCCNASETESCQGSQFGTTFEHSTGIRGEEKSMSCAADSRARTSAQQEKEQESQANEADCGPKWRELSAKYDPGSHSWKTHRCLWEEVLPWSSVILPRSGMLRDGILWERITPEPLTSGIAFGSLPTPKASDGERGGRGDLLQSVRGNQNSHFKSWPTPHGFSKDGKSNGPSGNELGRAVNQAMWPTPRCHDAKKMSLSELNRKSPTLAAQVIWPTPCSDDTGIRKNKYAQGGTPLSMAAKLWPTPTVNDSKNDNPPSQSPRNTPPLNVVACQNQPNGGSLNPTWVEWLMGWPLGWTDCEPLAMDKFQQWLRSHGGY